MRCTRAPLATLSIAFIAALAGCGTPPAARQAPEPGQTLEGTERDGYLTGAADARIYYRVLGPVEGEDTVVVVHGGPGAGMNSVLPDVQPLAEEFVLIFYDQRGGGRSELPADTSLLDARYFVEDLEAVRRHFRLDRLKLVTHSFGSVLVAAYAERYPRRVERIVLHGATGPERSQAARIAQATPPSPDTALSNRANELLRALLEGTAKNPVETCEEYEAIGRQIAEARGESVTFRGSTCDNLPEAVRYYYQYTAQLAPRTFGWDFTSGLEDVSAPVLVVYGARDSLALPAQRAWVEAFPDARLLLVPGAGKPAFTDRPDIIFPAVVTFLKGQS